MLEWLQSSSWAETISQSLPILSTLSSLHLLGLALVMSGVLGSSLRGLGVLFASVPAADIYRPATRLLGGGLAISAVTGFLMFMPRAQAAMANETFRIKLALIAGGLVVYSLAMARARADTGTTSRGRALAASTLALWAGVVLAGCAFILLE